MDTGTVLEIIKMIETKLDIIQESEETTTDEEATIYLSGKYTGLNDLRVHLELFIEAQLNAFENQSPEQ